MSRKLEPGDIVRFKEGNCLGWSSDATYRVIREYATLSSYSYCDIENGLRRLSDICSDDVILVKRPGCPQQMKHYNYG